MSDSRPSPKKLPPKRKRFADKYLIDCNAAKAYREVYGQTDNEVAATCGARLLRNALVRAYIDERQATLADKLGITAERILTEFSRIAFADPRVAASWGPNGVTLKNSDDLTDEHAAAIAEVSEKMAKDGTPLVGFKLHDKVQALNALAKIRGMVVDKAEVKHSGETTQVVTYQFPDNGRGPAKEG